MSKPIALLWTVLMVVAAVLVPSAAVAAGPQRVAGWDTYRRLDLLPYLTTDASTRQFSSFDRAGGNDNDGFDGRYSCRRTTADGCVIAEDTGAGEIASIWFTRFGGDVSGFGRIKITLDGRDVLDASVQDVVNGVRGAPFSYPLVANATQSSGGVYIKVPMPYRASMRVTVQQNPGFYHLSYRHFADATGITTFDSADRADDVLAKLRAAGTADPKPAAPGATTTTRSLSLVPGQQAGVAQLTGPGLITALRVRIPQVAGHDAASDEILSGLRLRAVFDGRTTVDTPLGEFFGSGLGEYSVKSLLFAMDPAVNGWYSAWWPMPYARNATVALVNTSSKAVTGVEVSLTSAHDPQWTAALADTGTAGHFTALSRRADVDYSNDWVFAELGGRGKLVGVSHTMNGTDPTGWGRTYLEGDERIYVDNAQSPQWYGTGTEDLYEGGWYFDRGPFSAPLTGHSAHESRERNCQYECDGAYRLLLNDSVAYNTHLRFGIEHGGTNVNLASYGSTAFLYTQPSRAARQTDVLDAGDPAARAAHGYTEEGSASQADLASVFEGDNDYVTVTDQVRSTGAAVSFRLAIDPSNRGVVLRRTSDQYNGYQSARVRVDGADAGVWSQPLNNTQQRWLDDEFLLPAAVTAGKPVITVRLEPQAAWTAAEYAASSVVVPIRARSGGTDFDGDGRDDIIAFPAGTAGGANVAVSTGTSFGPRQTWHSSIAPAGVRALTGDVTGDGLDDVVAFTGGPVEVSPSTGSSFGAAGRWHDFFAPVGETAAVGDVNGDGFADIVTFTHGSPFASVYVSLSTGSSFGTAQRWHDYFAPAGETPRLGDVNGDGLADILTFTQGAEADVYAALSTGSSFGPGALWHSYFAPAGELPATGDFDNDGLTDIVAFTRTAAADVFVATSNGWLFGPGRLWHDDFG